MGGGVDGVDGDGECDITVFVIFRYFGVQSSVSCDREHIPLLSSLVRLVRSGHREPLGLREGQTSNLAHSSLQSNIADVQLFSFFCSPSQVWWRLFILKTDIEAPGLVD